MLSLVRIMLAAATLASVEAAWADSLTVTDFHANPARSGNYTAPALTWAAVANPHFLAGWSGKVAGPIHAQPLYYHAAGAQHGQIIVSTDHGVLLALDAATGKAVWQTTLAMPVQSQPSSCGDPSKWPDVGTPVIDDATATIYVTKSAVLQGIITHLVFAVSLIDGSIRPGWPLDIAAVLAAQGQTFPAVAQAQRGALALVGGTLYIPYGGGDGGDCLVYHGWTVGLHVTAPTITAAWQTRAQWGGLWAQGGVTSDGTSIFVTTGNTTQTNVWQDGEAVLRLPPDLSHSTHSADFFTPTNWHQLDKANKELGGTGPLPLDVPSTKGPVPWILALGKDGNAYVLDRTNLGGIGGALLVQPVSSDPIRTAAAAWVVPDGVLVTFKATGLNCPPPANNIALTTIKLTATPTPAIATVWCGALLGSGTPTVTTTDGVTNPIVWMVGAEGDQQLHAFRGDTGQPLFPKSSGTQLANTHRYVAPLVAEGHLYVASDKKIYAFSFGP